MKVSELSEMITVSWKVPVAIAAGIVVVGVSAGVAWRYFGMKKRILALMDKANRSHIIGG